MVRIHGRFPYMLETEPSPRDRPSVVISEMSALREREREAPTAIFRRFDKLGVGVLGLQELMSIRRVVAGSTYISEQDTLVLYKEMDLDRDGKVGQADFQQYMEAWLKSLSPSQRDYFINSLLTSPVATSSPPRGEEAAEVSTLVADAMGALACISTADFSEIKSYRF